jgi:hypothetical protein
MDHIRSNWIEFDRRYLHLPTTIRDCNRKSAVPLRAGCVRAVVVVAAVAGCCGGALTLRDLRPHLASDPGRCGGSSPSMRSGWP